MSISRSRLTSGSFTSNTSGSSRCSTPKNQTMSSDMKAAMCIDDDECRPVPTVHRLKKNGRAIMEQNNICQWMQMPDEPPKNRFSATKRDNPSARKSEEKTISSPKEVQPECDPQDQGSGWYGEQLKSLQDQQSLLIAQNQQLMHQIDAQRFASMGGDIRGAQHGMWPQQSVPMPGYAHSQCNLLGDPRLAEQNQEQQNNQQQHHQHQLQQQQQQQQQQQHAHPQQQANPQQQQSIHQQQQQYQQFQQHFQMQQQQQFQHQLQQQQQYQQQYQQQLQQQQQQLQQQQSQLDEEKQKQQDHQPEQKQHRNGPLSGKSEPLIFNSAVEPEAPQQTLKRRLKGSLANNYAIRDEGSVDQLIYRRGNAADRLVCNLDDNKDPIDSTALVTSAASCEALPASSLQSQCLARPAEMPPMTSSYPVCYSQSDLPMQRMQAYPPYNCPMPMMPGMVSPYAISSIAGSNFRMCPSGQDPFMDNAEKTLDRGEPLLSDNDDGRQSRAEDKPGRSCMSLKDNEADQERSNKAHRHPRVNRMAGREVSNIFPGGSSHSMCASSSLQPR